MMMSRLVLLPLFIVIGYRVGWFWFEPSDGEIREAVAQIGGVKIGEDVSIGAGTCIDCGTIDDTLVGNGVKIDNQAQIGQ